MTALLASALVVLGSAQFTGLVDPAPAAAASTAGLNVIISERGRISASYSGEGSIGAAATLTVNKPLGASVRRAVLLAATTGFTGATMSGPVTLDGTDVLLGHGTPSGISSYNFWADVTTVVAPSIDAAPPGTVRIPVVEPAPQSNVDGVILAVIYDDPNVTANRSVALLFGALLTGGDRFSLALERPFDPDDTGAQMEMSLGISYSCQITNCGNSQYSEVDVNGRRLTSAAGGEDDGETANGALLTVGGYGDSTDNPADPMALPAGARSDDELYDLRPFLAKGDRSITVETRNPSADDNVFFAAFMGNPPVTDIVTGTDTFVYVALGDSYQSGEGAAFGVRPAARYLSEGYENGANFPPQIGPQDNTYTDSVTPPGDSCHRALLNYAKISRDKFKPGARVVLVDRTCSGATIEPSGKPAIVGKVGTGGVAADSQVTQAKQRLADAGLRPEDVDLVTVGMGGNDAKFGEIVQACLLPGVLRELLDKYPNSPGEIKFLDQFLSCSLVDQLGFKTDEAIKALKDKEIWAQDKILDTFPVARVLQVEYPGILPAKDVPELCGGISKDDVGFASTKIKKIDDAVRQAVAAQGTSRISVVKVRDSFGPNALCPDHLYEHLANGIGRAGLDAEITRLLNLDGNGDATARAKLDTLVKRYQAWKACAGNKLNPFDGDCDLDQAFNVMKQAAIDAMDYLATQQTKLQANLVSPPGTSDDTQQIAFDRSRGLFHPNERGFAVLGCNVVAEYRQTDASGCFDTFAPPVSTVNGQFVGNTPVRVQPTAVVEVDLSGFRPYSRTRWMMFSEPVSLGEVTADAEGRVKMNVTLPASLGAGVHLIEASGETASGGTLKRQARIELPGRPVGSWTTYLCCFTKPVENPTADTPDEHIRVTLEGRHLTDLMPDADGGVLVVVPTVDRLRDAGPLTLTATSDLTGKVVTTTIDPIPTVGSVWATGSGQDAVDLTGSDFTANGRVHSEGGLRIAGSKGRLTGGVEYGTTVAVTGAGTTIAPSARRVVPGSGAPPVPVIADYRPGGRIALSAPVYRAVPASACVSGVWAPASSEKLSGIVYVPCAVRLEGSGRTVAAQLVAEGAITVAGSGISLGTGRPGEFALLTAASGVDAVLVSSAKTVVSGTVYAPKGDIRISGSTGSFGCGLVAARVRISGSGISVPITRACLP